MNLEDKNVALAFGGYHVSLNRFPADVTVHTPDAILELILERHIDVWGYGKADLAELTRACINKASDAGILVSFQRHVRDSISIHHSDLAVRLRKGMVHEIALRLEALSVAS
jgi:hypothetical protein